MSDQIDQMADQFKSFEELKMFSDAQAKTIVEQSRKINKLEDEVKKLKSQIENGNFVKEEQVPSHLSIGTDQEVIAKIQLNKLKNNAFDRELTLDECRRAEILVKILNSGKKNSEVQDELPSDPNELLKALENFNKTETL